MIIKIYKEKMQAPCSNFQKGNDHLAWVAKSSAASPLHCLAMTLLANSQNVQKVDNDIVIFNGNLLGQAWHTWCKKGTNRKKMSCSLLICHIQICKSIDFRTMCLWKWITFFFNMHCTVDSRYNKLIGPSEITLFRIVLYLGCKNNKDIFNFGTKKITLLYWDFVISVFFIMRVHCHT